MMERFNYYYDYAYETPLYQPPPPIVEDICGSKSVASIKTKKGAKSEISTLDETWEDSSYLESHSSHSTLSKKHKKRRSKKLSEATDSTGERGSIVETRPAIVVGPKFSPYVTLSCPLCSDPECVLNVAASCPMLRHNEPEVVKCGFCQEHCECDKCTSKLVPVSGLVPRDENGVAETLLKANGGPIENSWEWANRRRWVVPYGVNWDHQVGQWITSRMLESSKTHLEGAHRKRSKSKLKRKSKHAATPTSTLAQVPPHTDTANQEHKVEDQKVILEGLGFKIIHRGQEKILINFDKKNCKVLGCSCLKEDKAGVNCGCTGWREEGHNKKCDKKDKLACKLGKAVGRVSVMKETSHGLVEVSMKKFDEGDKEKGVPGDKHNVEGQIDDGKEEKTERTATQKNPEAKQENIPEKPKNKKGKRTQREESVRTLTGRDVRNLSRADVLEEHLRVILGGTPGKSSKTDEPIACCPSTGSMLCQPELMMSSMEMPSPCLCAERYCYTSA
ncbi:hypothetical protein GE061_005526 [Apolygus lucorum]|uniref:Uncharacterized protein n=1 Tax=Apolygus lucorum TaxID=248454 RepID=A0A6A4J1Y9_APOLU|nr:hypothetical protein GE061_005526 [Apolygus lucorum]